MLYITYLHRFFSKGIKYRFTQCCPKRFSIKTKKGSKAKVE